MPSNYVYLKNDKVSVTYMNVEGVVKAFQEGVDLLTSMGAIITNTKEERDNTTSLEITLPFVVNDIDFTGIFHGKKGEIPGITLSAEEFIKACQLIKDNCPEEYKPPVSRP